MTAPNPMARSSQKLELNGSDRFWYFSSAAFFYFAAGLVVYLWLEAILSPESLLTQDAPKLAIGAAFAVVLALAVHWKLNRDLDFFVVHAPRSEDANFELVLAAAKREHWSVTHKRAGDYIQCQSSPRGFPFGERITVRFVGNKVYVNSIFKPKGKGTSLGRNKRNRQVVAKAVI